MTNSTFKPTHVRCVRYEYCDDDFTVGKAYKIVRDFGDNWVEVKGNHCNWSFSPSAFRTNTTGRVRLIYVGPPAILGDPIND